MVTTRPMYKLNIYILFFRYLYFPYNLFFSQPKVVTGLTINIILIANKSNTLRLNRKSFSVVTNTHDLYNTVKTEKNRGR